MSSVGKKKKHSDREEQSYEQRNEATVKRVLRWKCAIPRTFTQLGATTKVAFRIGGRFEIAGTTLGSIKKKFGRALDEDNCNEYSCSIKNRREENVDGLMN